MIGSTYFASTTIPRGYYVVLGAGVVLLVLGWAFLPLLMALGLPLLCGGLGGMLTRTRAFQLELRPDSLFLQPGDHVLPYAVLVAVTGLRSHKDPQGKLPYPLDVCSVNQGLRIPAHPDIPAKALEDFLLAQVSPFVTPPSDSDMAEFYDSECGQHGTAAVSLFHGRTAMIHTISSSHLMGYALAWFVGVALSFALMLGSAKRTAEPIFVAAMLMLMLGIFQLFYLRFRDRQWGLKKQKQHEADVLVVSPGGMAMRQGKLKGRLRWDEIRNIKPMPGTKSSSGQLSTAAIGQQTLHLQMKGATIVLQEVYDRSLSLIHQTIERNAFQGRH